MRLVDEPLIVEVIELVRVVRHVQAGTAVDLDCAADHLNGRAVLLAAGAAGRRTASVDSGIARRVVDRPRQPEIRAPVDRDEWCAAVSRDARPAVLPEEHSDVRTSSRGHWWTWVNVQAAEV